VKCQARMACNQYIACLSLWSRALAPGFDRFLTSPRRSVALFSRPNMCGGARIRTLVDSRVVSSQASRFWFELWRRSAQCTSRWPVQGSYRGPCSLAIQRSMPWWKSLRAIFAGPCRTGFPNGQSRDSRGNSRLHFDTDSSTGQDEIVRSKRTRRFPNDSD
jgi:hypothetical protein